VDAHDYMNDVLSEVTFENLGDAAITNISNQLHMMADNETFYSDSAELEVAQAVDELVQSCQALMLQRAMMAMWACISVLLLTSSRVAFSVRNALSGMQAGAGWPTAKIFRLWHKPIISSCCPSMTCNSQQYSAQALDFYNTDSQQYPLGSNQLLSLLLAWRSGGPWGARILGANAPGSFLPTELNMQITSRICFGWSDSLSRLSQEPRGPLHTVQ
jgi:hypothetical protein